MSNSNTKGLRIFNSPKPEDGGEVGLAEIESLISERTKILDKIQSEVSDNKATVSGEMKSLTDALAEAQSQNKAIQSRLDEVEKKAVSYTHLTLPTKRIV